MHRRSFVALALVAVLAPRAQAGAPGAIAFDQATYDDALAKGTPMLVRITAPWCPTCRAQKAVFADLFEQPRFAGLLVLDVDYDTRPDVVRALGARTQGTLIVYAGSDEVGRSVGQTDPAKLEALLAKAW